MVDRDEDVNELKWVVKLSSKCIFLYFDWFRCHSNHVLFFSPECNCSKLFWLWFQVDRFFPENTLPRFFSLVGRKGELGFLFAYLLVFKLNNSENLHWPFLSPERCSVHEAGPSSWGVAVHSFPRTFSSWAPEAGEAPPLWRTHLQGTRVCVPRMPLLVTAVEVSCRHSLTFSLFSFFFLISCHQVQLSYCILSVIANSVLYLCSHCEPISCQAWGFKN